MYSVLLITHENLLTVVGIYITCLRGSCNTCRDFASKVNNGMTRGAARRTAYLLETRSTDDHGDFM